MTIDEFFSQPIEQIILHADFLSISLDTATCNPYMWEITMKCSISSDGYFTFMDRPMPFERAKFHKLFIPITRNPRINLY